MFETEENLKKAFAKESQANRRYTFFADTAEREGYPQLARLFRAIAEAETVHARNHLAAMGGPGSTKENLIAGTIEEHRELTAMYPPFIEQAKDDNNKTSQTTFEYANEVEQIHYNLFQKALKALDNNEQLKDEPYFICQVCGNTVAGEAPEKCTVCSTSDSKFKLMD